MSTTARTGRKPGGSLRKRAERVVRCLGPGKEHTFLSTHPGNRVCTACQAKIDSMRLSVRHDYVVTENPL